MHGLCDQFLARPTLALDQNIRIRRRDFFYKRKYFLKCVAFADYFRERILAIQLSSELSVFFEKLSLEDRVFNGLQQVFIDERLSDVIVSTFAKCGDRRIDRRIGRHDDDQSVVVYRLNSVKQRDAVDSGHFDVGECYGNIVLRENLQSGFGTVGG